MALQYFDYEAVAREAGIAQDELQSICRSVRSGFPTDDMLFDLHVLRTCIAVKSGFCSMEDVLEDSRRSSGRSSGDEGAGGPWGEA